MSENWVSLEFSKMAIRLNVQVFFLRGGAFNMFDILRSSTSRMLLSKKNSKVHVADTNEFESGASPHQQELPVPPGNLTNPK